MRIVTKRVCNLSVDYRVSYPRLYVCIIYVIKHTLAIKHMFFLLSAYFLAVHSYKRMRLTTSIYGIITHAIISHALVKYPFTNQNTPNALQHAPNPAPCSASARANLWV